MFKKLSFTKNILISFISILYFVWTIQTISILADSKIYFLDSFRNIGIYIVLFILSILSLGISLVTIGTAFSKLNK